MCAEEGKRGRDTYLEDVLVSINELSTARRWQLTARTLPLTSSASTSGVVPIIR